MSESPIEVGFGSASLWGSWETERPLADEIDVRSLVAGGEGEWAAILAADVCGMWPSTCGRLRDAVAAALETEPERVGIFCTQNHGAPMEGPELYDLDRWEEAFVRAAVEAREAARPARMARVDICPVPPGVVNRRKRFGDMGSFSFYYGFELGEWGRAGCAHLLELALRGLACGRESVVRHAPVARVGEWPEPELELPEVDAETRLDDRVDRRLQGLFFRTPEGEPIGSLARWAAHPITANVPGKGHSGDYPAYVRRRLSEAFGGGALFLTGPCGNQAPLVASKSRELAEETGTRAADLLLKGLESASWRDVDGVEARSREVALPLRSDYPESVEAARAGMEEARRLFHKSSDLAERKRLAEEIERLGYTVNAHHYSWCGFRVEELGETIEHPLFGLRLGEVVIAGLPGEPFGSYSWKLRESFPGLPLLVAEEGNGYLSYIPGAEEYPRGGYGSAAAILAPEGEEVLLRECGALVAGLARG